MIERLNQHFLASAGGDHFWNMLPLPAGETILRDDRFLSMFIADEAARNEKGVPFGLPNIVDVRPKIDCYWFWVLGSGFWSLVCGRPRYGVPAEDGRRSPHATTWRRFSLLAVSAYASTPSLFAEPMSYTAAKRSQRNHRYSAELCEICLLHIVYLSTIWAQPC